MKQSVGKFSFAVPEGHSQAGEKIEKSFEFPVCETESEALQTIADKAAKSDKAAETWSIVALVNDALKSNARSNAYQAALLPYRPSEVAPEDIKERMVRDYIRLGVSEDKARAQVDALLASENQ